MQPWEIHWDLDELIPQIDLELAKAKPLRGKRLMDIWAGWPVSSAGAEYHLFYIDSMMGR